MFGVMILIPIIFPALLINVWSDDFNLTDRLPNQTTIPYRTIDSIAAFKTVA